MSKNPETSSSNSQQPFQSTTSVQTQTKETGPPRAKKGTVLDARCKAKKHIKSTLVKRILPIVDKFVIKRFQRPLNECGVKYLNYIIHKFLIRHQINLKEYDQDTLGIIYSIILYEFPDLHEEGYGHVSV